MDVGEGPDAEVAGRLVRGLRAKSWKLFRFDLMSSEKV